MTPDTDRALLEAAAKAAGAKWSDYSDRTPNHWQVEHDGRWAEWSPLTDDGDALRLAVKLRMRIDCFDGETDAGFTCDGPADWPDYEESEPHGDDDNAATRRAIVRAAAAIGEAQRAADTGDKSGTAA